MKINDNGVYREATPEEVERFARLHEVQGKLDLPAELRIAALEEELKATKILLGLEQPFLPASEV